MLELATFPTRAVRPIEPPSRLGNVRCLDYANRRAFALQNCVQ
jgi:hypothetical protein